MTRLPLDFGPLAEMADREAASEWQYSRDALQDAGEVAPDDWAEVPEAIRRCTEHATRLGLSDLTRPASRDAWLRWLGSALGWPESEHGPDWWHCWSLPSRRDLDGLPVSEYISAAWQFARQDGHYAVFCAHEPKWMPDGWRGIPNLDVSGPKAWPVALRHVILAVEGTSR